MFRLSKSVFIYLILLAVVSCKAIKVDSNSKLTKKSSVKEVLAIHNLKEFKYKTLQSRVKTSYDDGRKSVSPTITLRMEKDQKIWMSAKFLGFTVAKVYITPNRVSFYEKLNRRYYDGDFKALSQFLGQEVDFEKVQSLFLGQSILDLKAKDLNTKIQGDKISIKPKNQDARFDLELLINMLNAKVSEYKVQKSDKLLAVNYSGYQKIGGQDFPQIMKIEAKKPSKRRAVEMNFKSVTINEKLSFPYSIPEGYSKFKLGK